jgi:hypothetical protein
VTVLFVESPGSIAELGAFAASDELRPKTVAVLNLRHPSENSFIADGPVLKIGRGNEKHVHRYEWDPGQLDSLNNRREFAELAQTLTAFLVEEDAEREKQLSFKTKEIGHTLLLVADLIRFVGVATKSDLEDCLQALGCDTALQALERHLSILQGVGLIEKRLRANQTFFVRNFSKAFIRYAYIEGASSDTDRNQALVRESLDPLRKAVLRRLLDKGRSNV